MKIVGGMATPGAVNISSKNFSVVARLGENGEITHTTTAVSETERWLQKTVWIPKILKLFLFLFVKLTPQNRLLVLALLVGLPLLSGLFVSPEQAEHFVESGNQQWFHIILRVVTVGFLAYVVLSVRGFHAAEHMAIAAYEKHGVAGLDHIHEQDRVHNKCGGRMMFPLVVAIGLSQLVASYSAGVWVAFLPFVLVELVLWIDALIGYDKIALTQKFSVWFQKNITTKPPSEQELRVGRHALRQLLVAEGELPSNKSLSSA